MRFITIAFLCLFIALPANAATINEGAGRLKTLFENILTEQKSYMTDGATLSTQGDISIEQADSYYAVTLPFISIKNTDGSQFKLGIISVNVAPHNEDGLWKMTIAMPTKMSSIDKQGNEIFRLTIGAQKAAGIMEEKSRQFKKLDSQYKNITIETLNPPEETTIGSVQLQFDFNTDENGFWSGPGFIALNNFKIGSSKTSKSMSIDEIKGTFTMDKWDPMAGDAYKKRIAELNKNGAINRKNMSDEARKELGAAILDLFTKGMNGFDSTYSISNLKFTKPTSLDGKTETFEINDASFTFNIKGFMSNLVSTGVNVKYSGLNTASLADDNKDVIPTKADINIKINNIPFKELMQMGQNTLTAANDNPAQAVQLAGLTLMMKLPALLSQAGTSIDMNDNMLGNDLYNIALNGMVKADLTAVNSATANANMVFDGLDALIAKLNTIAKNPTSENAKSAQSLNGQLQFLKSIGKQSGDTYTFDFIMDEKGQMLLNGQNAQQLMMAPQKPALPPSAQ